MRGLYINSTDFDKYPQLVGIENKIKGQIKAYNCLNVDMDYISLSNDNIVINKEKKANLKKYKSQYIILNKFYQKLYSMDIVNLNEYDFIYIRFSMANIGCYRLVKYLKGIGKKVYVEIPTYPYQEELDNTLKNNIFKKIDNYLWANYKKNIFRLVLTNDLEELYGVKAINIFNGINTDDVDIVKNSDSDDITINMIAVANISAWHGYDRVIEGLSKYYEIERDYKINFYLVGGGEEKFNLEQLVKKRSLEDRVKFLGVKRGDELNDVFNGMHIGVSSLALFRAGGGHDPIKSKEYIGRGLPVLLGYKDRALDNKLPFVYEIEGNETPVDIEKIVEKYLSEKISAENIRQFARENLSWESQMKKIVDLIK